MKKIRISSYAQKRINRVLTKSEQTLIMDLFIHQKREVQEISVLLNLNIDKINGVLFKGIKPFKNYVNRGVCAFSKKTAYWETEQELIESFDPSYSFDELDPKELAWFRYHSNQTKIIMSKIE